MRNRIVECVWLFAPALPRVCESERGTHVAGAPPTVPTVQHNKNINSYIYSTSPSCSVSLARIIGILSVQFFLLLQFLPSTRTRTVCRCCFSCDLLLCRLVRAVVLAHFVFFCCWCECVCVCELTLFILRMGSWFVASLSECRRMATNTYKCGGVSFSY